MLVANGRTHATAGSQTLPCCVAYTSPSKAVVGAAALSVAAPAVPLVPCGPADVEDIVLFWSMDIPSIGMWIAVEIVLLGVTVSYM